MQENKINKTNIIIIFLVGLIFAELLYIFYTNKHNQKIEHKESIIKVDTNYNTITLDSIKYNIIYKDIVITNLKQEMEYETDKVFNMSNNDAVKLFYELVSE